VGDWRRLHSEELHNLYASPNIIKMIRLKMRWASIRDMRNAYNILVGKHEEKTPLGRPRHRW
jgi:hypothetical protein